MCPIARYTYTHLVQRKRKQGGREGGRERGREGGREV
jgi:hypothetical protein